MLGQFIDETYAPWVKANVNSTSCRVASVAFVTTEHKEAGLGPAKVPQEFDDVASGTRLSLAKPEDRQNRAGTA
jgi:hypothetical protein